MKTQETLLGFQLRVTRAQLEEWSAERRAKYLLREDIERPLSIDLHHIWPLCKDKDLLTALFSDFDPAIAIPQNGMDVYFLKPEACLEKPSRAAIVAITAFVDAAHELKGFHKISEAPFDLDALRGKGWKCMGYDVADRWFYSGLMNCGYKPEEKAVLAGRFGSRLSDAGLFKSSEDAEEFRAETDRRVPEHAPFYVFGLWTC